MDSKLAEKLAQRGLDASLAGFMAKPKLKKLKVFITNSQIQMSVIAEYGARREKLQALATIPAHPTLDILTSAIENLGLRLGSEVRRWVFRRPATPAYPRSQVSVDGHPVAHEDPEISEIPTTDGQATLFDMPDVDPVRGDDNDR